MISFIYGQLHMDKLQLRSPDPIRYAALLHERFVIDNFDRWWWWWGEGGYIVAQICEPWTGVVGHQPVICWATRCIWFHNLFSVKAERILVTWGRNKTCAPGCSPDINLLIRTREYRNVMRPNNFCGRTLSSRHRLWNEKGLLLFTWGPALCHAE